MRAALVAIAVLRFALRLELGPEFDSNANHAAERPPPGLPTPVESFLLRATGRARLSWNSHPHSLRVALDAGGKWFFTSAAAPQDAAALRLSLDERSQLTSRFSLGVAAEYHDVGQPRDCPDLIVADATGRPVSVADTSCHRDFRTGTARLVAVVAGQRLGLAADAGVRGYQWKPDGDLSFLGVGGALSPSLRWHAGGTDRAGRETGDGGADWALTASGRFEWRAYSGPALRYIGDLGQDAGLDRRGDLVGTVGLQLSYAGPLVASAGYLIEADRSNSAGGSYLYQALTLGLSLPLPARMVAAMRAQLLFFSSGVLPNSLSAEDENRDSVLFDLSREMGRGFSLRARYAVYRNAAADLDGGYLRQLVFLGATWETR